MSFQQRQHKPKDVPTWSSATPAMKTFLPAAIWEMWVVSMLQISRSKQASSLTGQINLQPGGCRSSCHCSSLCIDTHAKCTANWLGSRAASAGCNQLECTGHNWAGTNAPGSSPLEAGSSGGLQLHAECHFCRIALESKDVAMQAQDKGGLDRYNAHPSRQAMTGGRQ
jgi:hypothetical protein